MNENHHDKEDILLRSTASASVELNGDESIVLSLSDSLVGLGDSSKQRALSKLRRDLLPAVIRAQCNQIRRNQKTAKEHSEELRPSHKSICSLQEKTTTRVKKQNVERRSGGMHRSKSVPRRITLNVMRKEAQMKPIKTSTTMAHESKEATIQARLLDKRSSFGKQLGPLGFDRLYGTKLQSHLVADRVLPDSQPKHLRHVVAQRRRALETLRHERLQRKAEAQRMNNALGAVSRQISGFLLRKRTKHLKDKQAAKVAERKLAFRHHRTQRRVLQRAQFAQTKRRLQQERAERRSEINRQRREKEQIRMELRAYRETRQGRNKEHQPQSGNGKRVPDTTAQENHRKREERQIMFVSKEDFRMSVHSSIGNILASQTYVSGNTRPSSTDSFGFWGGIRPNTQNSSA